MHRIPLTLAFLTCLSSGNTAQSSSDTTQRRLAKLLLAFNSPSAGWQLCGQAHDPATALRRKSSGLRMAATQLDTQEPGARERWDRFLTSLAACTEFNTAPSIDSALSVCKSAATSRDCEPQIVCEALETIEKGMRAAAKSDDGELSRSTLASLDGAWRLVFTTGTAETQSKLGRKINYFPLRATQTFNTSNMAITNGIYLGKFPLLRFFGSFDWLEDKRRLEFDFSSIAVGGIKFNLPTGGAEELGAATGLGAKNNVKRAKQGKKAFFNWISADDEIATARGGGGGLALWRRDLEMESIGTSPPTIMTPTLAANDSGALEGAKPRRKAEWNPEALELPGCVDLTAAPVYLDGSLPGDVGFDPLCLLAYADVGQAITSVAQTAEGRKSQMQSLSPAEQQRKVAWMREAELKHARLAMLATAGWPLAELWNSGSLAATNGRAPSLFNGHLGDYGFFLFLISLVLHTIEIKSFDSTRLPGDLGFDPLNYYSQEGPTKQRELQFAEIMNGRFAMMAITGFAAQEFIWGTPVVKQTPFFFR